ncbi:MAG: hypothetical protein ACTSW1_05755 [Candidatus Hodarchaeales archaeon]
MVQEVIFCLINQLQGHQIVYSKLDSEFTKRISLRTQVALGLVKGLKKTSEVTLPLSTSNGKFVIYSLITPLDDLNIGILAWIFSEDEKTTLFTKVPLFRKIGINIIRKLEKNIKGISLEQLKNMFVQALNTEMISQQLVGEKVTINEIESLSQSLKDTGFVFLKSIKDKELTQLLQASIFGDSILVIGDEYVFNMLANNLLLFNYQGVARKAYFRNKLTTSVTEELVMTGIPSKDDIEKKLLREFDVVFNLSKKKVDTRRTKYTLEYVKELVKKIKETNSIDNIIDEYFVDMTSKNSMAMLILNTLTQENDDDLVLGALLDEQKEGVKQTKTNNVEATLKLITKLKEEIKPSDFKVITELGVRNSPLMKEFLEREIFKAKLYTDMAMGFGQQQGW